MAEEKRCFGRVFRKRKRLATDTASLTDKYGMFWAQPLNMAFGTTIGDAFRRVLLSSSRAPPDRRQN